MATVYTANDPRFKREVAIKVLPSQYLHDPTFRARFEREAQTIAAIEHPAIVPVYDFGEQDDQPYIVMRFMAGGSLDDRLKRGPLSLTEAAQILARLAPALDEIHKRGIIHRDLKPGNILFDQYGNAFLSDFGIARLTESSTLTGDAIIGTPSYMSPEQARGEPDIDGRSDIYALGAILFEMLTGRLPYQATTPMGVAMKHITDPVPRVREIKADLPSDTEEVICRAMAKEPSGRFSTASEMADTLVLSKQVQPPGVTVPAPVPAPPPPAMEPKPAGLPPAPDPTQAPLLPLPPITTDNPVSSQPPLPAGAQAYSPPPGQARPPTRPPQGPSPRPRSRSGPPVWVWVLGGIGLVVGCVVTASLLGLMGLMASSTPTPVAAIQTPTEMIVLPENTPEIVSTQTPNLFTDDFSDPNSGWDSDNTDGSISDYHSGSYRVYVARPRYIYWGLPHLSFSDVSVEVDATKRDGPDDNFFGVICRYQDAENFYLLAISSDGYYGIMKFAGGESSWLGTDHMLPSPVINTARATNHLRADCIGENLALYANGAQLLQVRDSTFPAGDVGLFAGTFDTDGTDILFDNFAARKP